MITHGKCGRCGMEGFVYKEPTQTLCVRCWEEEQEKNRVEEEPVRFPNYLGKSHGYEIYTCEKDEPRLLYLKPIFINDLLISLLLHMEDTKEEGALIEWEMYVAWIFYKEKVIKIGARYNEKVSLW